MTRSRVDRLHCLDAVHYQIDSHLLQLVEILAVTGRLLEGRLHGGAIIGMGALEEKFQTRFRCPVVLEDSESFV
jgi:hypothetical protein